jgi:hypothetical protein
MDDLRPGDILELNNLLRGISATLTALNSNVLELNETIHGFRVDLAKEDEDPIPTNGWIPGDRAPDEELIVTKHYRLKVHRVTDKSAPDVDGTWAGFFDLTTDDGHEIHTIHQTDNFKTMEEAKDTILDAAIEWFGDMDNIAQELSEIRERRED